MRFGLFWMTSISVLMASEGVGMLSVPFKRSEMAVCIHRLRFAPYERSSSRLAIICGGKEIVIGWFFRCGLFRGRAMYLGGGV